MDRHAPTALRAFLTEPTRLGSRSVLGLILLLTLSSGCSQPGPFLRRQTMMGALKSNVAQLESEKEQLAKQLAEQKSENRRVEAQLAEIDAQNGDLAARLDDARTVISRQGYDDGKTPAPSQSASGSDRSSTRRATPARSAPSKGRKTPFAQIPNERRSLDESEDRTTDDGLDSPPSRRDLDDFGPQSRLDDHSPWMPVARGATSPARRLR
ncbi:MAG: hypothetical protein JWN86_2842 [Planctomycetota bacterium]|nr:hypothetical protein [Planctomycetota bacterium]